MESDYDCVVITHGGCADGTASAHLFSMFPVVGKVRVYYSYEREFSKNRNMPSLVDKKVFIVDYSFPIDVLINIARVATRLYLYDHHETSFNKLFVSAVGANNQRAAVSTEFAIAYAENNEPYIPVNAVTCGNYTNMLANSTKHIIQKDNQIYDADGNKVSITRYCNVSIVIDLSYCGSEVVWNELTKMTIMNGGAEKPRPWYLGHIRDRDLWLWDKPGAIPGLHYDINSKPFGEAFFEARISCETLKLFDMYSNEDREKLYARGRALIEHNARIVKSFVSKAQRVKLCGYDALVSCSDILQSEIGNALVKTVIPSKIEGKPAYTPTIGVVYRYNLAGKYWMVSLRGQTGSPNLAEIAEKYGGGGHPLAAGFDYYGNITEVLIDNPFE